MFTIKVIDSYNGAINPSTDQIVKSGESVKFRFIPKPDFDL